MRLLKLISALVILGILTIFIGGPFFIIGGLCFALALYGIFWLCLPAEKRCGWGYKSCGGPEVNSSSRNNSAYDWQRNDWRDDPGHRFRSDNIYHRIDD
jgi:phage shock protein PspC (stress-responsive transcriptional regulator)